jgi:Protein of unknown function (DUF2442).
MRLGKNAEKNSTAGLTPVPWRVVEVRALPAHRLFVRFVDGLEGEVDARAMIFGPKAGVFAPLRDPTKFAEVGLDAGAVAWPGGLDIAPDAMYDEISANGQWTINR